MTVKLLHLIPLVLFAVCMEQRAVERFNATVNRLCVTANPEQTVDQHLSTHPQGCVLVALGQTLAAGLNEALSTERNGAQDAPTERQILGLHEALHTTLGKETPCT